MGSGDWFKNIISLKKAKKDKSKKLKGSSACTFTMKQGSSAPEKPNECLVDDQSETLSPKVANGAPAKSHVIPGLSIEEMAAIRIQTAFRAYKVRKGFCRLRGVGRLQSLTQGYPIQKQASTTLSYLHSWSRIQAEIRARRVSMVIEGRLKQKKLENQLKLEAKLHDLEVEWNAGSETMEEVLARIHQREEAAVKRERTLAYAFSHQWRPNSNSKLGNPELGKANWGWSWMDRWIAARPWESRVQVQSSTKKGHSQQNSRTGKKTVTPTAKTSVKTVSPNGKSATKPRKLTYEAAEKTTAQKGEGKPQEANAKKDVAAS